MPTHEEIHNALTAIYARLGTVEGRVTLIARSRREELREELEALVRKHPIVGQIYLALDGERNQTEVFELLDKAGIETSAMGVSRWLKRMYTEDGIVELVSGGGSRVYRKSSDSEAVLNLSTNIRGWLGDLGAVDPAPPAKRKKGRQ